MKQLIKYGLLYSILLVLMTTLAFAQSTPLSVSGTVYRADGVTQAAPGTFLNVTNSDNEFFVSGKTGTYYNPGRYAAVVDGNPGDTVRITASDGKAQTSVTVVVSGSMHNINLVLNASNNYPPVIISEPPLQIGTNELYVYAIEALDFDQDPLSYSLLEHPTGMTINQTSGIILWPTTDDDEGLHQVTVVVTDPKNATDNQSYMLRVLFEADKQLAIDPPLKGSNDPPATNLLDGNEPYTNTVELPYYVVGSIKETNNKPARRGTAITITNKDTGEKIALHTGIGPFDGAYAVILPGKRGSNMSIAIDNDPQSAKEWVLQERKNYLDFKKSWLRKHYKEYEPSKVNTILDFLRNLFRKRN